MLSVLKKLLIVLEEFISSDKRSSSKFSCLNLSPMVLEERIKFNRQFFGFGENKTTLFAKC